MKILTKGGWILMDKTIKIKLDVPFKKKYKKILVDMKSWQNVKKINK